MGISTWSGVDVLMSSQLGAAVAITGISKANPAVVTHGGADPANGDYVFLTVQGMSSVNGILARVANAGAGTFELEGIDSTNFNDFSSGSFQVSALDVSFATITGISSSGGETNTTDTTTIHQLFETNIPTTTTAVEYSLTSHWDITDAGLQAANKLSRERKQAGFLFSWPNGNKAVFAGYVNCSLIPTGNAQEVVETPLSITVAGEFTYYAT